MEGINFVYIARKGVYFVATTMYNTHPSLIIECLEKVTKIIKDFCGILNEESLRKNFVLIYEIVDEVMDYGYPQMTSTELVRPFIVSDPIMLESQKYFLLFI